MGIMKAKLAHNIKKTNINYEQRMNMKPIKKLINYFSEISHTHALPCL
jgi:hypothetical protein